MTLNKSMPVNTIAKLVNEHDTRPWRMMYHYVEYTREKADHSQVTKVGMDETSCRRGHKYVSLFVDLDGPRVLFATDGKDASTVKRFKQDLISHRGDPGAIEEMCWDMSPAFISDVEKQFPEPHITFDKSHVLKVLNDAVDQVCREEIKDCPVLKGSSYIWLKNQQNLKASQTERLEPLTIKKLNLKTSRAYHIWLNFQELYQQPAEAFLKKWYCWVRSKSNNCILEGINSLIQAAQTRARGYRTRRNLMIMIYLSAGKRNLDSPT